MDKQLHTPEEEAYLRMLDREVPDLWSRIEAGLDRAEKEGSQNREARFLAGQETGQIVSIEQGRAKRKGSRTGLIIGICAAAAVIIAAVLCIFVFDVFGLKGAKDQKSAEAVCKKMFKSMENADADALLECFPEGIDAALDIVDLNGSKTEIQTALDMMKGFGLTFKDITIDSAEKMDAEALKAELKESGADIKVKEAEKVHVKATMSVSIFGETQEETQEFIVICAKVGNKWYIINTEE